MFQIANKIADHFGLKDKLFVSWFTVIPVVVMFNKDHVKQILSKNEAAFLNKSDLFYKVINDFVYNGLLAGNVLKPNFIQLILIFYYLFLFSNH